MSGVLHETGDDEGTEEKMGKPVLVMTIFLWKAFAGLSAGGRACVLKQLSVSTAMSSARALWFVNILNPLVTHSCSSCLW